MHPLDLGISSYNLKAMEKSQDRVSNLPDCVLYYILSLMPMKSAVRTSILSSRWRNLWKCVWMYTTTLDFGLEFAGGQSPEVSAAMVNRYLELHRGKRIDTFRLFFNPGCCYQSDVEKWIEFAAAKGVKEFDLDFRTPVPDLGEAATSNLPNFLCEDAPFKLPDFLFGCNSVTNFKLTNCNFSPPMDFKGFNILKSLRLKQVDITDDMVETIVSNCPLLVELILRECFSLGHTKVSAPDIPLKFLAVIDCSTYKIEISAPNLQSFHFCGDFCYEYSFKNISSLVDALINSTGHEHTEPEHDYIKLLTDLDCVKVLTLCEGALLHTSTLEEYIPEELPITLHNVQELQLVMSWLSDESLSYLYAFIRNCFIPCLEKLFIDLPYMPEVRYEPGYYMAPPLVEEPSECSFHQLKAIKINCCRGHPNEIRLLKFLLEKAIALETLVLVMAPMSNKEKDRDNAKEDSTSQSEATQMPLLSHLREQLLLLPKASPNARIVMWEYARDDNTLCPTHTNVYCKL